MDAQHDEEFLQSLGLYRNFFYISRFEPAKHHFRVTYRVKRDGSPGELVLSGRKPKDMSKAVDLPGTLQQAEVEEGKRESFAKFTRVFTDELKQLLPSADPTTVMVEYLGAFSVIDITEFIIRSKESPSEHLKSELQKQLRHAEGHRVSELERLDLECMLSLLHKPPSSLATSSSPIKPALPFPHPNAGDPRVGRPLGEAEGEEAKVQAHEGSQTATQQRLVVGASVRLCMGKGRVILNEGCFDHGNVKTFTTSLRELNPQKTYRWLYIPALSAMWRGSASTESASCGSLVLPRLTDAQAKELQETVAEAVKALANKAYSNPIHLMLASQGDPSSIPETYKEYRPFTVVVEQYAGEKPPKLSAEVMEEEDVEEKEPSQHVPSGLPSQPMSMSSLSALPPLTSVSSSPASTTKRLQAQFDKLLSFEEDNAKEIEPDNRPQSHAKASFPVFLSVPDAFTDVATATVATKCLEHVSVRRTVAAGVLLCIFETKNRIFPNHQVTVSLRLSPVAEGEYEGTLRCEVACQGNAKAQDLPLKRGEYTELKEPSRYRVHAVSLLPTQLEVAMDDSKPALHTVVRVQNGGIW